MYNWRPIKGSRNYKYYKNMEFATEIREAFEKKYVKVFLKESDDIELVKSTLEQIKSICMSRIVNRQFIKVQS